MRLPIQKDLYPGDLFLAKNVYDSLAGDRQKIIKATKECPIFELSFWDKEKWPSEHDVPDHRMYYFAINYTEDAGKCLDEISAWLFCEIIHAQHSLVEFYEERHAFSKATVTKAGAIRSKRHRIPIWYGVVLWLSLAMFIPGFYMMISKSSFLGGLALVVGSVVPLYIFLTKIKRHQISSIV